MSMATIYPKEDFDVDVSCETLKNAMDGFGTNEDEIINTLASLSNYQRQEVESRYKTLYGESLLDDITSELSGNMENITVAMITPPRLFDAKELNRAMSGAGTDEGILIELMVTRTNAELEDIKAAYQQEFETSLEEDLMQDTSGYFRRLLVSLCNASRDDDWWVDESKVVDDAQLLFDAGEGQLGTDECAFNSILCSRTLPQLNATFIAYEELAGKTIVETIEDETSGAVQDGYMAIVKAAKDLHAYFAERVHDSVACFGTEDRDLIRLIVSRSEVDLQNIKEAYESQYEKPLREAVENDCGGDYLKMLLAIIGQ